MMNLNVIFLLLAFQLLGEFLHRVVQVPLSGPLIGMTLLFVALSVTGGPSVELQNTTRPLLATLALLFVPAGVGIIAHLDLIGQYWMPILVATVGGTAVSLLVAAATMLLVERLLSSADGESLRPNGGTPPANASPAALDGEPL